MRSRPEGPQLLDVAREALLEELMDKVPESHRYTLRMAANAMAIAAREAQAGERDLEQGLAMLAELYGADVIASSGEDTRCRARAMMERFAKDIRAGIFDGACAQGVRALLMAQVCARLRISNPKYLRSVGLE